MFCNIMNGLTNFYSSNPVCICDEIDEDEYDEMHDNTYVTDEELMQIVKGPDFPTGALILGKEGIKQAYTTGRGKITLRAETEIEEMANGKQRIIVTSLPYQVNKAKLIENIADFKGENAFVRTEFEKLYKAKRQQIINNKNIIY